MEYADTTAIDHVVAQQPKPAIHERMTFAEILAALDYNDNCVEKDKCLTTTEIDLIVTLLPRKVDGCAQWVDKLKDDAKRAKEYASKFAEAAKQIEAKRERFMGYVKHALESKGFEKMTGEAFTVSIQKNRPSVVTNRDPTADEALLLDKYVRTKITYEWKKPEINEALKAGEVLDFAELEQTTKAVFGIKKG
jgi:hypothetical protein